MDGAAYWFVLFLVIAAVAVGGAVGVLLGVATFFALLAIYAALVTAKRQK